MEQSQKEKPLDSELLKNFAESYKKLQTEIGKVIVGQREVIDKVLISLFSKGHVLIVGVPGLAKTLLISTIARALDLSFNRVQFTPDLMPSDITGTDIIEEDRKTGARSFKFIKGPIFSNIVLADEINRTPPKTQAALLQAMQESRVTVSGNTYELSPAVLRAGHTEPYRTGRNLSAARSSARQIHVQHPYRLSDLF